MKGYFAHIYVQKPLLLARTLRFYIEKNEFKERHKDIPLPFDIYWKVRNRGEEAIKRNCIRGQIKKGTTQIEESTSFMGGHFVECYIVSNGVCIARDRIDVPIFETPFAMKIKP